MCFFFPFILGCLSRGPFVVIPIEEGMISVSLLLLVRVFGLCLCSNLIIFLAHWDFTWRISACLSAVYFMYVGTYSTHQWCGMDGR